MAEDYWQHIEAYYLSRHVGAHHCFEYQVYGSCTNVPQALTHLGSMSRSPRFVTLRQPVAFHQHLFMLFMFRDVEKATMFAILRIIIVDLAIKYQ